MHLLRQIRSLFVEGIRDGNLLNHGHQGLGTNQLGTSSLSDRLGFRNTMGSWCRELRIQVIESFQRLSLLSGSLPSPPIPWTCKVRLRLSELYCKAIIRSTWEVPGSIRTMPPRIKQGEPGKLVIGKGDVSYENLFVIKIKYLF